MEKAGRRAVGKAALPARACGKRKAEHPGRARAPIAAAPLHLMACDVPVVSPPVPVVHVPDATVAAHGEPVSVVQRQLSGLASQWMHSNGFYVSTCRELLASAITKIT